VLGIEDPQLLREIHDRDERCSGIKPCISQHSQMENVEMGYFGQGFDSKFSVLKVNQKPRGLFTNSSNLQQSSFHSFHSTMSL